MPKETLFNLLLLLGNHTIAIVKGKEEQGTLEESLAKVIKDVNRLADEGQVIINGEKVDLEFYLGGDYKAIEHSTFNLICIFPWRNSLGHW